MHPWTRAYRDIYSVEDIDTMKYTWQSPQEVKAKEEYDRAWAEIKANTKIVIDYLKSISINSTKPQKQKKQKNEDVPTNKEE